MKRKMKDESGKVVLTVKHGWGTSRYYDAQGRLVSVWKNGMRITMGVRS